jgi:DNA ligase 1
MRAFAALYDELDTTTSILQKTAAIERYLRLAAPADASWAVFFLSGRRLKRLVGGAPLRRWLTEESGLPPWLVEETYAQVGDLAETIALLVAGRDPDSAPADLPLAGWLGERILPLRDADEATQRAAITGWWRGLPLRECFVVTKLLTGALRVGVSGQLVTRAVAAVTGQSAEQVARQLLGDWEPSAAFWAGLCTPADAAASPAQPYPFFLAHPLDTAPEVLGSPSDFVVEWKWDGIRAQLIRRDGTTWLWSRGVELITARFPEVAAAAAMLPDGTVLDGELLAWRDGRVAPFALLQTRIGRTRLSAAALQKAPVRFLAYDLLEWAGQDVRGEPLQRRRERLESVLDTDPATTVVQARADIAAGGTAQTLGVSPTIDSADWETLHGLRATARDRSVEGLMLKSRTGAYGTGRQRGGWWKWKIDPLSFDGVLLYAQPGHGRRSNLYTDYSFAVWNGDELVVVAKAYSGLTNDEITRVDRWIRAHTKERFGPVRSVVPELVFEIGFEGIARSPRHKSGIALRFPRILRQREDKPVAEADTLATLSSLLHAE